MTRAKEGDPKLRISGKIRAIAEQRFELAQEIRGYVKSQVDIWRKLPNWILEGEGRSGYSDRASKAYTWMGLEFAERDGGISLIEINLRSGDVEGSDENILRIVDATGEVFDAQAHLDDFKKSARRDYDHFSSRTPRKTAQWRADIRERDPFLQETLDPSLTLEAQVNRLKGVISEIEKLSTAVDSELTPEQVKNAISHVLRASDFDDQPDGSQPIEIPIPAARGIVENPFLTLHPPTSNEIRGVHEIMQSVAFYIRLRSPQFAPLFAKLSHEVWHNAVNATARVRHERGMVHRNVAEWMYTVLGNEYTKRADGNKYASAPARKKPIKPTDKIGLGEAITGLKVADWFLDTPAE